MDAYQLVNKLSVYMPVVEFSSLETLILRTKDNTFISVLMDKNQWYLRNSFFNINMTKYPTYQTEHNMGHHTRKCTFGHCF